MGTDREPSIYLQFIQHSQFGKVITTLQKMICLILVELKNDYFDFVVKTYEEIL